MIKKWLLWSWLGSFIILSSLWVQVKIDVKINEWFGKFYDMIQKALAKPNAITIGEHWESLFSFISLLFNLEFLNTGFLYVFSWISVVLLLLKLGFLFT
jgi:ABC-type long-subunit fatty acid transport system fused permease/ATPase subunit